jgi:hypothetical protein
MAERLVVVSWIPMGGRSLIMGFNKGVMATLGYSVMAYSIFPTRALALMAEIHVVASWILIGAFGYSTHSLGREILKRQ